MITYSLTEICQEISSDEETVVECIKREWVTPYELSAQRFDEQDLLRLRLIFDLKNNLAVNDEGIDIILHLLDQMHATQRFLRKLSSAETAQVG